MSLHNVVYSAAEYQKQQEQPAQIIDIGTDWVVTKSSFYQKASYNYSSCVDTDGNVYSVLSEADENNTYHSHIQKHDVRGTLLWEAKLTGEYNIHTVSGVNLTLDESGNLYLATSILETSTSTYAVLRMAKISKDGVLIWQKLYRSTSTDVISLPEIIVNSEGEIFVTATQSGTNRFFWVAKLNNSGNLIWRKAYTNTVTTNTYGIGLLPDGHVVSMHIFTPTGEQMRTVLTKHDALGNLVSFKTYQTSSFGTQATSMVVGPDGNIYLAGRNTNASPNPGLIMKINSSSLEIVWQKTLTSVSGGTNQTYLEGIDVDSDGNVFVCGHELGNGYPAIIAKLTSEGALVWCNGLDSGTETTNDTFRGLTLDHLEYIVVGGFRTMSIDGYGDSVVARFPKDGSNLNKVYGASIYQSNPIIIGNAEVTIDTRTYSPTTLPWTEEAYAPALKKVREYTVFS